MIAQLKVHDYEGAVELLGRAIRHVEEHIPGTLAWDCYIDKTSGNMVWYEEFADEQALVDYEKSMTDHGFRQAIREYGSIEGLTVLGPVSDPELLAMLAEIGGIHLEHTLGVTR
jgi:quinol monooxygenase YgiN